MNLGINSVLFGGHDMEEAFKYTQLCGYDGIELSAIDGMSEHLVLDRWQEIAPRARELSRQYNLPITAMEQPSQDPAKMQAAFEAAAEIGIAIVNCGPGGKANDESTYQGVVDSLGKLADRAKEFGVTLCFKAHVGQYVHNTPTTLKVLAALDHPNLGLDMDPSHIWRAAENPVEAISAVVQRIRHVHIRDCKGRQQSPGPPEMQANGRGDIDLLGYLRVLHESGYAGPVNLEIIGAKDYDIPPCVAIAAEARTYAGVFAGMRGAVSINVGILGFAHGHVGVYCDQWRKMPDQQFRQVAGWDHDAARSSKSGLQTSNSPAELLDRVDAVVIGAETSLHADLVEAAAAAGKAIILQKPLALTMEQGERIVAAVEQHKVPFTLAWQMRVDPQNIEMKRLIESGAIGRVYMIRRRHGLSTHIWPGFENTWHVKPGLNRGMWADDACHAIDFLLWLLGEPKSVTAEIGTFRSPKVPDDHGIAVFRYADGTFAEVVSSFTCLAGENTTEIVGEEGVIIQNYGDGPSCQVPHPPGGLKWLAKGAKDWTISPIPSPASHSERIAALAPELARFLLGQRPSICTAEEGLTSLRMTLASYRSAELGRRVMLSEV